METGYIQGGTITIGVFLEKTYWLAADTKVINQGNPLYDGYLIGNKIKSTAHFYYYFTGPIVKGFNFNGKKIFDAEDILDGIIQLCDYDFYNTINRFKIIGVLDLNKFCSTLHPLFLKGLKESDKPILECVITDGPGKYSQIKYLTFKYDKYQNLKANEEFIGNTFPFVHYPGIYQEIESYKNDTSFWNDWKYIRSKIEELTKIQIDSQPIALGYPVDIYKLTKMTELKYEFNG